MSATTPSTTALPGEARPYVLESGGGRAHLLIDQVGRTLVGAEESGGAWSVMQLDGPRGRPVPLHFHRAEHETFYCTRGTVQLWLGEESRILAPGDLGSVPAGTIHSFQLHGHHSSFVGPITPGGWDRFFDLTGLPYEGGPYPVGIRPVVPFEKFGQAEGRFDMKYLPEHPYAEATTGAPDDALPGARVPYVLRAGEGPRHVLGGALHTTILSAAESDGDMAMATVVLAPGAGFPGHVHERSQEAVHVLDGRLRLSLDGTEHLLTAGDTASIPAGAEHGYVSAAHHTKVLVMHAPAGPERLAALAGEATEDRMVNAGGPGLDLDRLAAAAGAADATVTAA